MKTTHRLLTVGSTAATLLLMGPALPASAGTVCQSTLAVAQACASVDVYGYPNGCEPAFVSDVPHWWCFANFGMRWASGGGTTAGTVVASLTVWGAGPSTSCAFTGINGSCTTGPLYNQNNRILLHSCDSGWISGVATARTTTATTTATDSHPADIQVFSPC